MDTPTNRWPAFLIALVLAFAAISCWSLERAASEVSAVNDPNYYHHGLHYNRTGLEARTARDLGWSVTPALRDRVLSIEVADAQQAAIAGCQGTITLQAGTAGPGPGPALALTDAGHGRYTVTMPANLPPTIEANLTLSKAAATIQRRLLLSLAP